MNIKALLSWEFHKIKLQNGIIERERKRERKREGEEKETRKRKEDIKRMAQRIFGYMAFSIID